MSVFYELLEESFFPSFPLSMPVSTRRKFFAIEPSIRRPSMGKSYGSSICHRKIPTGGSSARKTSLTNSPVLGGFSTETTQRVRAIFLSDSLLDYSKILLRFFLFRSIYNLKNSLDKNSTHFIYLIVISILMNLKTVFWDDPNLGKGSQNDF